MRIQLIIAYDGTDYCGWQVQPNGVSIQALLQRAIETVVRHPIDLTSAGRTDAGVHAIGQSVHFDVDDPWDMGRLSYSVNALLPTEIRVMNACPVDPTFHARYSAKGKIYHYHLHLDPYMDPILRRYRTRVYGAFERVAIESAIPHFLGTHDFAAFANQQHKGAAAQDSIRTLKRIDVVDQEGGIRLEFEGDGFLYKMVRNISGTLIDVAKCRRKALEIPLLLQMKQRIYSGSCAPPEGLFLVEVLYS